MAIAVVQTFSWAGVLLAGGTAVLLAVLLARKRFLLLVRRTRWLILSLVVLFALATPGIYCFPVLGSWGPTQEGVRLGVEHLMRLLFVIATVAILLQTTGLEGLLAGLYSLMRPLSCLGFDRRRLALRMMLVIRYVEESPDGKAWRNWLQGSQTEVAEQPLAMPLHPWRLLDFAVLAGLTFLLLLHLVSRG